MSCDAIYPKLLQLNTFDNVENAISAKAITTGLAYRRKATYNVKIWEEQASKHAYTDVLLLACLPWGLQKQNWRH